MTSAKLKLRAVESTVDAYVYTVDDNAYQGDKLFKFNGCYDPTWRRCGGFLGSTYPALGNHEYTGTSSAGGYCDYFEGQAAMTGNRRRVTMPTTTSVRIGGPSPSTAIPRDHKKSLPQS